MEYDTFQANSLVKTKEEWTPEPWRTFHTGRSEIRQCYNNIWIHQRPLLIKSNHNDKSEKDFVKLKLHRDLISEKLDLYELKIALFDNDNLEYVLLYVCNVHTTIYSLGTLDPTAKAKYLRTIVCEEVLRQFDLLYAEVESENPLIVEAIVFGLGAYFPPVNSPWKKERAMRSGMRKPCWLKWRHCVACLVEHKEYLIFFLGKNWLKNWYDGAKWFFFKYYAQ